MHFAFPPRKTSRPPPYAARSSRLPLAQYLRRGRIRTYAIIGLGIIAFLYLISGLFRSSDVEVIPAGTPPVVIVTTFSKKTDSELVERIKQNRESYATKHGYKTFFRAAESYDVGAHPSTWSKIPAMRHALTLHPHTTFFWYLDEHALIMNPSLSLSDHILDSSRIESLMIKDVPVVPPDSVIKTFSHLRARDVDLIISQDKEGLGQMSFILRRGEWAKTFLDAWFDPLYRSYNFQKAEAHALEHLVQWHGTILSKLILVDQRILNSYVRDSTGKNKGGLYKEGDLVANFIGCGKGERKCEEEMIPFLDKLEKAQARADF